MSVSKNQYTDEGLAALRGRPNITDDLVWIFTRADQRPEVQECVIAILEMSSKGSGEQIIIYLSTEMLNSCSFGTPQFRTLPLVALYRSREYQPQELCG